MSSQEDNEEVAAESAPLRLNFPRRRWLPFIILWALSPAMVFVIGGFFVETAHIHPESPEYPADEVNVIMNTALFLAFTWSVWCVLRVARGIVVRLALVIPVTVVVFWVNAFIGAAGCSVADVAVGR